MSKQKQTNNLLSFYKTVLGSIMTQGFAIAISFIGSVLLARILGAQDRGMVAWVVSLATLCAALSQLGMNVVNRRFVAEDKSQAGDLIIITLIICLGLSILVVPLAFFFALFDEIGKHNQLALMVGLLMTPLMAICTCLSEMLVGLHKPKQFNIVSLVQKITNTILIVLAVTFGILHSLSAIIIIGFSFLLQTLVILYFLRKLIKFKIVNLKPILTRIRLYMLSNYVANLLSISAYALMPILIGSLSSLRQAGLYTVCVLLLDATRTVPGMIGMYALPKLVAIKDPKQSNLFKFNVILVTIGVMLFISMGFFMIGDWLIPFLFGKDFIQAVKIFKIMTVGLIFASIFSVAQPLISAQYKGWIITLAPFALIITTIVLSVIMIPQLGALGAAYVWVVAYFTTSIVTLFFSLRTPIKNSTVH